MRPRDNHSPEPTGTSADDLLDEYLLLRERGEVESFEAWLKRHPGREAELRLAQSYWRKGMGVLEGKSPAPGLRLVSGQVLGDFRLVAPLGRGSQGMVWAAYQLSMEREVALKLARHGSEDERALAFSEREARAGGRLVHPGIVATFGHGRADGTPWIAQELVPGGRSLRDLIAEARQTPELTAAHYRRMAGLVARVADALAAAHAAGVIHRDVKPANILLAPDGNPKVSDFGLARVVDEGSQSSGGEVLGTYLYMSPEQVTARSGTLDERSDVFSLGVVMYELLTLQRPFEGDTLQQICSNIQLHDPPDPRRLRSRCPADLAVICLKAIEKAPGDRYGGMTDLAADLRRHLASKPILARPAGRPARVRKWVQRNPYRALAGGIAGLAFVSISTLAILLNTKAVEAADSARREKASAEQLLSLAAFGDLEELTNRSDRLWPPVARNIEAYDEWIEDARAVVAGLDPQPPLDSAGHRGRLQEIRARARSPGPEEAERDREEHPARVELARARAELEFMEARLERELSLPDPECADFIVGRLDEQAALIADLESALGRPWRWHFTDDLEARRHDQLSRLVSEVESLENPERGLLRGISEEHGWGIVRRRDRARQVATETIESPEAKASWGALRERLRRDSRYVGLEVPAQEGLVPIGPDPESGYEEFGHPLSGSVPVRRGDGSLAITEDVGLVFVLLPGGDFVMGAQDSDPDAPNHDPLCTPDEGPPHGVRLSPFFLSKYETTQGQWERFMGSNPSLYRAQTCLDDPVPDFLSIDLTHPVEWVSWDECTLFCERMGLSLPTEAQWEYAARGGTSTVFWTGNDRETLRQRRAVNLADQAAARAGAYFPEISDWPELDDGYPLHAPASALTPNGFGFHHMTGNLWEWCLDVLNDEYYAQSPVQDPVCLAGSPLRVARGGGFWGSSEYARSAYREAHPPTFRFFAFGFRPARAIETRGD